MDHDVLQQIARGLFYAPFPTLTLDSNDRIVDYNIALEVIAGNELNGLRYKPLDVLMDRFARRVTAGVLIPRGQELWPKWECKLETEWLGPIQMTGTQLVCRNETAAQPYGRIVFWDVAAPGGSDPFHERFRANLDRQLTWDTYAWSYDRVLNLMPYYQEVVGRHLAALKATDEGPILDLGAGTGNLVEQLILAGRHVTAVDTSRAMLDKLRSKPVLAAEAGKRLAVIEANAEALSMFEDGSFAGVSLLLVLFDTDSPEEALDTAVRLLGPAGVLVITELKTCFRLDPILEECERQLRRLDRYEELADDLDRVVHSNRKLAPGSRSQFRAEDVYDALVMRGFGDLSLKDSHFGQCATVTGRKPDSVIRSRS